MLTICLSLMKIFKEVFQNILNATKGWVILHSASGSVVSNGEEEFFYKLPEELMLKDVNVLGAGDIFASCFLYKLLLEGYGDIRDWIEFCTFNYN